MELWVVREGRNGARSRRAIVCKDINFNLGRAGVLHVHGREFDSNVQGLKGLFHVRIKFVFYIRSTLTPDWSTRNSSEGFSIFIGQKKILEGSKSAKSKYLRSKFQAMPASDHWWLILG